MIESGEAIKCNAWLLPVWLQNCWLALTCAQFPRDRVTVSHLERAAPMS